MQQLCNFGLECVFLGGHRVIAVKVKSRKSARLWLTQLIFLYRGQGLAFQAP
jgi:hypothetical protein